MAWKQYQCEISGKAALVLVDDRFAQDSPVKGLPLLSWVGIYCNRPPGGAFWDPEETVDLNRMEDELVKLSDAFGYGWAVYLLRIATPGVREYFIYHADQAELSKAFSALKATYPNYRVEFETTTDMAWEQYGRYVSAVPDDAPQQRH